MKVLRGHIFPHLIALFPLLFPLYLFRATAFGLPVTFTEVVLSFAALYFVFREGIWKASWWRKHPQVWKSLPLLLFLIAGVFSVLVSPAFSFFPDGTEFPARLRALGILKGWILFPMLYFFMAKTYFFEKPSLIQWALRALLMSGVILSLYALYQVLTGDFITPDARASGPFESANFLSLYLAPLLLYAGFAIKNSETTEDRFFLAIAGGLCMAALFFTFSYAAWLGVLGATALGLYLQYQKRISKWLLLGSVAVLLLLGLSQVGSEKFQQFIDFQERSSTTVRLQVYDISLGLLSENPLLGIGLGQYELQYQLEGERLLGKIPFESVMLHPHNIYLAFWLNMGLLGLIAFLWMVWRALGWLAEKDKRGRQIVALMLVVILIHGLFDTPYFKNDLAFEFWLLMAILL